MLKERFVIFFYIFTGIVSTILDVRNLILYPDSVGNWLAFAAIWLISGLLSLAIAVHEGVKVGAWSFFLMTLFGSMSLAWVGVCMIVNRDEEI